jgi:hypothetical protein
MIKIFSNNADSFSGSFYRSIADFDAQLIPPGVFQIKPLRTAYVATKNDENDGKFVLHS